MGTLSGGVMTRSEAEQGAEISEECHSRSSSLASTEGSDHVLPRVRLNFDCRVTDFWARGCSVATGWLFDGY